MPRNSRTTPPTRQHRTYVEMPKGLVEQLHTLAEFRGTNTSSLCYLWFIEAARLADQGRGDLLPQVGVFRGLRRRDPGTLGPVKVVRWKQGQAEWDRLRALIDAAGSTVPAVLEVAAAAYIAAGGDVLAMAWPPKSAAAEAA